MVSRRPNSKDTVSDRAFHQFLKNFAGINFRESPILKNFEGINFHKSTNSGVRKGIYFREFSQNSRNFLPAKVSSLKVPPTLISGLVYLLTRFTPRDHFTPPDY